MSDKRTQPGCRLNPTALRRPAAPAGQDALAGPRRGAAAGIRPQRKAAGVRRGRPPLPVENLQLPVQVPGRLATGGRRPASHVPASPPEVPPVRSGPPAQPVAVPDRHQSGQRPAAAQPAAQGSQSGPCAGRRRGQSGSVAVARLRGPGGSARALLGGERGPATGLVGLERLPQATKQLLVLVKCQGLAYQEVAELLDIPLGTVKSRMNEALPATPPVDRRQQIPGIGRTEVKRSRKREAPPQLEWVGSEVNADGHAFVRVTSRRMVTGSRLSLEEPDAAVEQGNDIAASGMEREGLVVGPAVLRGPRASRLTQGYSPLVFPPTLSVVAAGLPPSGDRFWLITLPT